MGLSPELLREFPRWEAELGAACLLSLAEMLRSGSPELVRRKFEGKREGQGCLATHCGWSVYGHSHGAGRRFSRTAARKRFTADDLAEAMGDRTWLKDKAGRLVDEIPGAYKDIDQVMADATDLVEVRHTLRQIVNVKGD